MTRSPLARRTPLARGTSTLKRTPIAKVGRKAKREALSLAEFRRVLRERSGGMCELATPACPPGPHPGHHAHHCAPSDRDRGRHDPSRGLLACAQGHAYAHANPSEAYARGWLIRSWEVA